MSNNKAMKDLSRGGRRLGQQLHDLRENIQSVKH